MKAPLEHLESSTPMSAGEGGVYLLMAGALVGIGIAIGWTRATLVSHKNELVERRSGSARTRREDRTQRSNQPKN